MKLRLESPLGNIELEDNIQNVEDTFNSTVICPFCRNAPRILTNDIPLDYVVKKCTVCDFDFSVKRVEGFIVKKI